MGNWRVVVQTASGQIKEVYLRDYLYPEDASRAALAQTGAAQVVNCFIDWSSGDTSAKAEERSDAMRRAGQSVSDLRGQVNELSDEVADLRLKVLETAYKGWANKSFDDMWEIENDIAESEGRPPLSYKEMVLIWGDPNCIDSFAMYERPRDGARVPIECPHCDAGLRIPDGRKGMVECPACGKSFYTDATHEFVRRPDKDPDPVAESGDCFIATAAYGVEGDCSVKVLRTWRDNHLLKSRLGRYLCHQYRVVSPPIAGWISRSQLRRRLTRVLLIPIVVFASAVIADA